MILFILDNPKHANRITDYLKDKGRSLEDSRIFFLPKDQENISASFRPYLVNVSDFSVSEQESIDQKGWEIATQTPSIPQLARKYKYRDINLLSLLTHGCDYFWIHLIKQVTLLQKVLLEAHPEKVVLISETPIIQSPFHTPVESYATRIAETILSKRNIDVEKLIIQSFSSAQNDSSHYFLLKLTQVIFRFFCSVLNRFQKSKNKPSLCVAASPRVSESFINQHLKQFQWTYLSTCFSPKVFLRYYSKGVASTFIPQKSTSLKNSQDLSQVLQQHSLYQFEGLNLALLARERVTAFLGEETQRFKSVVDETYRILKHSNLVLLDEDTTPFHRLVALVSKKLHIPSIVLMHGITGQKRGFTPMAADRIAVWGKISKEQLVRWGISENKIAVTGYPNLSTLPKACSRSEKRVIKNRLGLSENKKIIFYPANRLRTEDTGFLRIKMTQQQGLELWDAIVCATSSIESGELVIKVHPGDDVKTFQNYLKTHYPSLSSRVHFFNQVSLADLLAVSDVVVSFSSTVCLEALSLDIPVVDINLFNKSEYIPFGECDGVLQVTHTSQIAPAVRKSLEVSENQTDKRKQFVEDYLSNQNSNQEVFNLIQNELKRTERIRRLGVVVQARMSSERLPNKMLKKLQGRTVLEHLVRRLKSCVEIQSIVIATSGESSDDSIAKECERLGITCFRGSLEDVLDRYYQSVKAYSFESVVRITGDCPLLEMGYLSDLINLYRNSDADYASAKDPKLFPRGTTAEIFSRRLLEVMWKKGQSPEDREHVTWYVRSHLDEFQTEKLLPRAEWNRADMRLALDEEKDWNLLDSLFSKFYNQNSLFGLDEITNYYEESPQIFHVNSDVTQRHSEIELAC